METQHGLGALGPPNPHLPNPKGSRNRSRPPKGSVLFPSPRTIAASCIAGTLGRSPLTANDRRDAASVRPSRGLAPEQRSRRTPPRAQQLRDSPGSPMPREENAMTIGKVAVQLAVLIGLCRSVASAQSNDRREFWAWNNPGKEIREFYASPHDRSRWMKRHPWGPPRYPTGWAPRSSSIPTSRPRAISISSWSTAMGPLKLTAGGGTSARSSRSSTTRTSRQL